MLSTIPGAPGRTHAGSTGAKRTRTLQRRAHLLTGLAIVAYVYADPAPDSAVGMVVRWLLLPGLIVSGLAMWQWPRLRRLARRRAGRP